MSDWFGIALVVVAVVVVCLPCRYDPAIRLKGWLSRERFPD